VSSAPIEVPEDLPFTRRSWTAERIGWGGLVGLLLAGVAGLLGSGPLSRVRAEVVDVGPRVEYDRFVRRQSPFRLRVEVPAARARDGVVHLWIERSWHDAAAIERVQPFPLSVRAEGDRVVYAFAAAGEGTLEVAFDAEFERAGRRSGRFGVLGGGAVKVKQRVYP
jgi:hypothetical protein